MMQINLSLSVATVDFLNAIDGKEIVLDTGMDATGMITLMIHPKDEIFVGAIDDIFEDCEYDLVGGVDVQFGFDSTHPFKYELGMQLEDSSPFILNNDLMFKLINQALIHKGLINEDNVDDIVFTKECYVGIQGVQAIVHINDDDMIMIEDVEILDPTGNLNQNEFLDWINNNYSLVNNKMESNMNTWKTLLDELRNKQAILHPRSAYELANVIFEYDETKKSLKKYNKLVTIPKSDLQRMNQLLDDGLDIFNEIINVDFNNDGNLGIFMESMAKNIPINFEMVNISDNMIELNFNHYYHNV